MPIRFTVERIAPDPGKDRDLTDQEVFDTLMQQMESTILGGTLQISVRATEQQVDKAMNVLMSRIARIELACMKQGIPIP